MSKQFTAEEVRKHNKKDDCWIILDGKVYDVTKFLEDHPGGEEVVIDCAGCTSRIYFQISSPFILSVSTKFCISYSLGRDATSDFDDVGHSDEANNMRAEYEIGTLAGAPQKAVKTG